MTLLWSIQSISNGESQGIGKIMISPNWRNTQTHLWHISVATILKGVTKSSGFNITTSSYRLREQ